MDRKLIRSHHELDVNIAEAWRKRRYELSFVSKLNDAEAEATETQTWLEFAVKCGYADRDVARRVYRACDNVVGKLVRMIARPEPWLMPRHGRRRGTDAEN